MSLEKPAYVGSTMDLVVEAGLEDIHAIVGGGEAQEFKWSVFFIGTL